MNRNILTVLILSAGSCTSDSTNETTQSVSNAAINYGWTIGRWNCNSGGNSISTTPPMFKTHPVREQYVYTLVADDPDRLLIHGEYTEQSLVPDFAALNYEADIEIRLDEHPGPQGHTASIAGEYSDGTVFEARGHVDGTGVLLGSLQFNGNITAATDGVTRGWSLTTFGLRPSSSNPLVGLVSNARQELDGRLGTQRVYLFSTCQKLPE